MGLKRTEQHFVVCDWCQHEEEYGQDQRLSNLPRMDLPGWLVGRTHYKTSRGESPVTLCPNCTKIYEVLTQGTKTPKGTRLRAWLDEFFSAEAILGRRSEDPNDAFTDKGKDDDDDDFAFVGD